MTAAKKLRDWASDMHESGRLTIQEFFMINQSIVDIQLEEVEAVIETRRKIDNETRGVA